MKCPTCGGSGRVANPGGGNCEGPWMPCDDCNGTGDIPDAPTTTPTITKQQIEGVLGAVYVAFDGIKGIPEEVGQAIVVENVVQVLSQAGWKITEEVEA